MESCPFGAGRSPYIEVLSIRSEGSGVLWLSPDLYPVTILLSRRGTTPLQFVFHIDRVHRRQLGDRNRGVLGRHPESTRRRIDRHARVIAPPDRPTSLLPSPTEGRWVDPPRLPLLNLDRSSHFTRDLVRRSPSHLHSRIRIRPAHVVDQDRSIVGRFDVRHVIRPPGFAIGATLENRSFEYPYPGFQRGDLWRPGDQSGPWSKLSVSQDESDPESPNLHAFRQRNPNDGIR